jgi:hypothetical protein
MRMNIAETEVVYKMVAKTCNNFEYKNSKKIRIIDGYHDVYLDKKDIVTHSWRPVRDY